MTRPKLEDFPPAVQAQIKQQLGSVQHPKTIRLAEAEVSAAKPILRQQRGDQLNKLEKAFLGHLQAISSGDYIHAQAITLKLANGVRYTPDVLLYTDGPDGHGVIAYEVKGFMRDDAAVKLKVAASLYPWIKFILVWRKAGEWQYQQIFP